MCLSFCMGLMVQEQRAAAAPACSDADRVIKEGKGLLRSARAPGVVGNPAEVLRLRMQAYELFLCMASATPDSARALYWLGAAELELARFVEAAQHLQAALDRSDEALASELPIKKNLDYAHAQLTTARFDLYDTRDRAVVEANQPLKWPVRGGVGHLGGLRFPLPMTKEIGPLLAGPVLLEVDVSGYKKLREEITLTSCWDQARERDPCQGPPRLNRKTFFLTPEPLWKRPWFWATVGGAAAALTIGLSVGLTYAPRHEVPL